MNRSFACRLFAEMMRIDLREVMSTDVGRSQLPLAVPQMPLSYSLTILEDDRCTFLHARFLQKVNSELYAFFTPEIAASVCQSDLTDSHSSKNASLLLRRSWDRTKRRHPESQ